MNFIRIMLLATLTTACTLGAGPPVTVIVLQPTVTPTPTATAVPSPTPTRTPVPFPWTDERATMSGVCFEAALARANEVIVLQQADEHIAFYNDVDASGDCRLPITRNPFEFVDGTRTLAGVWVPATGCDTDTTVTDYALADGVLRVDVQVDVTGDCPYELIEPFWVGVDAVTDVQISVATEGGE